MHGNLAAHLRASNSKSGYSSKKHGNELQDVLANPVLDLTSEVFLGHLVT